MKKILLLLIITPIAIGSFYLYQRYHRNQTQIAPYPYVISKEVAKTSSIEAPIVIIGDRMGSRLGKFSNMLSRKISENLSKPVSVVSIATDGEGVHRTLAKVKALPRLPLFLIYLGGSEETIESKFSSRDIPRILKNIELYENEAIQTLLMIFPVLSRFLYHNVNLVKLSKTINNDNNTYSNMVIQKRNEIEFKLYEYHLSELFKYSREHNSILMAISGPINLDVAPKKSCSLSINESGQEKLQQTLKLIRQEDFKSAYNLSKELILLAPSNAQVQFIHGKICKQLGKTAEAIKHLRYSIAFDCENWRPSPVFNAILKKVAREEQVLFYDFDRYLQDNWRKNITFEDDLYPQNFYMEKMINIIAAKVRRVLKL